jgi:hypothetical protein
LSLAAYVAEDGLVGYHWEDIPLGLANFICLSKKALQSGPINGSGWVGEQGEARIQGTFRIAFEM